MLDSVVSGLDGHKSVLVFKHSTRCAISGMAKNRLASNMDERLSYFILDVISQRSISNYLATKTGVQHESPQVFLYVNGVLVSVESHSEIRPKGISERLDSLIQI